MALPICEKVWTFPVINQFCGNYVSVTADGKDFLLKLKNGLKLAGWTVWQSCDSVAFGTPGDGVDRWLTASNLVFSSTGAAKSWIVLKNSALAAEAALLLSCDWTGYGDYANVMTFSVSGYGVANGGANGNATTAPTSAAAGVLQTYTSRFPVSASPFRGTLHIMASSDRECTRVLFTDASVTGNMSYMFFEKAKNPVAEWTVPVFCIMSNYADNVLLTPTTFGGSGVFKSKISGTALDLRTTCEASGNVTYLPSVAAISDDPSSDWPMLPMSLCCVTAGHRNWRKGQIYDLWWGNPNVVTGETYPASGSTRQFVQIHQMIFPWDGLVTPGGTPIILNG